MMGFISMLPLLLLRPLLSPQIVFFICARIHCHPAFFFPGQTPPAAQQDVTQLFTAKGFPFLSGGAATCVPDTKPGFSRL